MSTATAVEAPTPPAKGKKKKLIIIIAAVAALVLVGGGGAAYFLMKKKANAEAEVDAGAGATEEPAAAHASDKHESKSAPVFVPLDPFTVNLADREAERYAQIGITLEVEDAHTGDQIKNYMPAIRNNILMAIADRTAADLMGRDGKTRLADRVKRETSRALGYAVAEDDEAAVAADKGDKPAPKTKKQIKAEAALPVKAVHFSNFIIQ
jgi:flagellar FliL protein